MTRTFMLFAAVAGLFMSSALAAHHGSAAFDTGKEVVLQGTVVEWLYANPHCLLKLVITREDGTAANWIAEGQAPNTIFPIGYRKDSFKAGDRVTITVEPAKNNQPMGRILKAVLADGKILGRASSLPPIPGTALEP